MKIRHHPICKPRAFCKLATTRSVDMLKRLTGLVCLSFFAMSSLSANDMEVNSNKNYCSTEQIELTDSMILVNFQGKTFEIGSLQVDQGGFFFTDDMTRCAWCRRPLNPKNICEYSH